MDGAHHKDPDNRHPGLFPRPICPHWRPAESLVHVDIWLRGKTSLSLYKHTNPASRGIRHPDIAAVFVFDAIACFCDVGAKEGLTIHARAHLDGIDKNKCARFSYYDEYSNLGLPPLATSKSRSRSCPGMATMVVCASATRQISRISFDLPSFLFWMIFSEIYQARANKWMATQVVASI